MIPRGIPRTEWAGLALLAAALVFGAIGVAPELSIGRFPLNDSVLHLAASERLVESVRRGEPFLDPWVSEWALGYPLWRSYQPLPHVLAGAVLWAASSIAAPAAAFAALQYVLIVLLPLSVYVGARRLGLAPTAAGLASLLVLAPSGAGHFGGYGIGYGSTVWRGTGLFTQLVAVHAFVLTLGGVARSLDDGRRRPLASLLLAITSLCHIVWGYVAFVSAAVCAVVGEATMRGRRIARLAVIVLPALALLLWFVVPLFLARGEINHSRWEADYKWDSFGAPTVLRAVATGELLDGGRLPILTALLLIGLAAAVAAFREPLPRRLLALTGLWLVVFFGRDTWGHLLLLLAVPPDLHLHRVQGAFELSAVLLSAWGLDRVIRAAHGRSRPMGAVAAAAATLAIAALGVDRAAYLGENSRWGIESHARIEAERADLEASLADVNALLRERPGRAAAGLAATWGNDFRVGSVAYFSFLTRAHIDQASFLHHAMSKTSDLMVLRDENDPDHAALFGIRAVVAPADRVMPAYLQRRAAHGRFVVYESSPEGYFGLVDVAGRYTGPPSAYHEPGAAWLKSALPRARAVIALGADAPVDAGLPAIPRWAPLPPAPTLPPCGAIADAQKEGETYRASLRLDRPCHALVKITWHPDLAATLDGAPVPLVRVTPGFGAVAVPAGTHEVVVRYAPGPLRPALFVLGWVLFLAAAGLVRRPAVAAEEDAWGARLDALVARLATPRNAATAALLLLAVLALRPLFRGRLVAGHDALCYPPRLVEMARVVAEGHLPPVWAPDLGAGHGQPLFEFAPPLVYAAALPLHFSGARLADALQLTLAALHLLGAAALYRLGRRARASRAASVAGTALWLFAPYTALDLYVRSAYAEATAVALAPVALLALLRVLDRPTLGRVAVAASAVALLPLAHNGAALMLFPALAAIVAVGAARRGVAPALAGVASLAFGLVLAAFFWLPALAEKVFVQTDLASGGFMHWSRHLVALPQLLWSRWGHGLSGAGAEDGLSFALGVPQLVLGAIGLLLAWRSRDVARRAEAATWAALALAGVWLATSTASFVWARVEMLQFLQFPWRLLMLPGLFLPLLAVFAVERLGLRATAALVVAVVALHVRYTEPLGYTTFDDEYYAPWSLAEKGINTTTQEEYTPRWVEIERRPAYTPAKLRAHDGRIDVLSQELAAVRQRFTIRADGDAVVEAATAYYPGWTVRVDGRAVPVEVAPVSGTMRFRVPAGDHTVALSLEPTPVRRAALWISLLGVAALAAFAAWALLGRRASAPRPSQAAA